jgi:hypothetical protein
MTNDKTTYDVISLPIQKERTSMITVTDEQRAIAHQLGLDPEKLAQRVALNSRGEGDCSPYISFSVSNIAGRGSYHNQAPNIVDKNPASGDIDGLMKLMWDSASRAMKANTALTREAAIRELHTACTRLLEAFQK